MGYFLANDRVQSQNSLPSDFLHTPKSLTPDPRLKERGYRFYQPETESPEGTVPTTRWP